MNSELQQAGQTEGQENIVTRYETEWIKGLEWRALL
jgi:hypothetical protein